MDNDWAGNDEEMKSISGSCFTIGTGVITWSSKKQGPIAQSTAEAEYIGVSEALKQAVWLRKLMADLGFDISEATLILCDNCAAISIAKSPVLHSKTKYIKVKYHAVPYYEEKKEIKVVFCCSEEQLADAFTKPLSKFRFEVLRMRGLEWTA